MEIVPGVVDDAGLVVGIEAEAWQDYVHELRTRIGLLYSGAVDFLRGGYDDWDAWEPALRCLYSGTPIYDPENPGLVGLDGSPLDLQRKFRLDDDPEELAHYLATAGFLAEWEADRTANELRRTVLGAPHHVRLLIARGAPTEHLIGSRVAELELPPGATPTLVSRNDNDFVPSPKHILDEGDHLTIVADPEVVRVLQHKYVA